MIIYINIAFSVDFLTKKKDNIERSNEMKWKFFMVDDIVEWMASIDFWHKWQYSIWHIEQFSNIFCVHHLTYTIQKL